MAEDNGLIGLAATSLRPASFAQPPPSAGYAEPARPSHADQLSVLYQRIEALEQRLLHFEQGFKSFAEQVARTVGF